MSLYISAAINSQLEQTCRPGGTKGIGRRKDHRQLECGHSPPQHCWGALLHGRTFLSSDPASACRGRYTQLVNLSCLYGAELLNWMSKITHEQIEKSKLIIVLVCYHITIVYLWYFLDTYLCWTYLNCCTWVFPESSNVWLHSFDLALPQPQQFAGKVSAPSLYHHWEEADREAVENKECLSTGQTGTAPVDDIRQREH